MLNTRIYNLLKSDMWPRTVTEIADALKESEISILRAITEMSRTNKIRIAVARPLDCQIDQSTYYTAG